MKTAGLGAGAPLTFLNPTLESMQLVGGILENKKG